jgi:hypothetical protein
VGSIDITGVIKNNREVILGILANASECERDLDKVRNF